MIGPVFASFLDSLAAGWWSIIGFTFLAGLGRQSREIPLLARELFKTGEIRITSAFLAFTALKLP